MKLSLEDDEERRGVARGREARRGVARGEEEEL